MPRNSLCTPLQRLQVLLAGWAGACPICRRRAPHWQSRRDDHAHNL